MHVETQPLEASPTAPGQSWFARLIAFIAWLFNATAKLKRIRPTTRFKPDWRDRYPELLSVEWHRDQMLAQGAALLLSGKTLDSADYVHIPMPPGYGGPCPRTPFQIARRWLVITDFLKNPEAHIIRHAQRIARRATSPSRPATVRRRLAYLLAHDGLPRRSAAKAQRSLAAARARAPPKLPLLPTAYSPLPQTLRA